MRLLRQQLGQDPQSAAYVRIGRLPYLSLLLLSSAVRYETLEKPNRYCRAIFSFLYNSSWSSEFNSSVAKVRTHCRRSFLTVHQICNVHFSDQHFSQQRSRGAVQSMDRYKVITASASQHRLPAHLAGQKQRHHSGRQLRLKSAADAPVEQFRFVADMVSTTGKQRLKDFSQCYQMLPADLKRQLDSINRDLQEFGYSLGEWYAKGRHSSVLDNWEF